MLSKFSFFKTVFLLMILVEVLSFISFMFQGLLLPLLVAVFMVVFVSALYQKTWGIYMLFGELFIGSRGRLLDAEVFGFDLSLRMIVFIAVIAGFTVHILKSKFEILKEFDTYSLKLKSLYFLFLAFIGYAIVQGIMRGHALMNVFQDANGYLYLLIIPVMLLAVRNRVVYENILRILGAAVIVIALKTLLLYIWFGYGFFGIANIYHWVVAQDIGEITGIVGSASRIFMQSQFYALVGVFIFGSFAFGKRYELFDARMTYIILAASFLSVLMSLSRSFWFGAFFASLFMAMVLLFYFKVSFTRLAKFIGVVALIVVIEIGGLYALSSFGSGRVSTSVASRAQNPTTEAAGGARLLLLPKLLTEIKESPFFGKGFGELVSYKSFLPDRITEQNPDGEITSFAFEWGYLDMLLKFGAVGFSLYLFFIAHIFALYWQKFLFSTKHQYVALGMLSGLVALLVLNITTPYLNHPLGIGYLGLLLIHFNVYGKD